MQLATFVLYLQLTDSWPQRLSKLSVTCICSYVVTYSQIIAASDWHRLFCTLGFCLVYHCFLICSDMPGIRTLLKALTSCNDVNALLAQHPTITDSLKYLHRQLSHYKILPIKEHLIPGFDNVKRHLIMTSSKRNLLLTLYWHTLQLSNICIRDTCIKQDWVLLSHKFK